MMHVCAPPQEFLQTRPSSEVPEPLMRSSHAFGGPPSTVSEVFVNASLPPQPSHGSFGVCYVAFAGTHDRRYRGERLLELAATQLRAAAKAAMTAIPQCVVTDQPEWPRPYVDLVVPLRSSAAAGPFVARCAEYSRRFQRSCSLYFGYMAKAVAARQAPYAVTTFVDTDTFVCDAAPLLALPRLMRPYDLLLHLPRTTQGWINSGVLVVRRDAAGAWVDGWLREFESLDDFGDQLHLLKVLPPLAASPLPSRAAGAGLGPRDSRRWAARGGDGAAASERATLRIGELPVELHVRQGNIADSGAQLRLPATRGPAMLLHSKGLAALAPFLPFFLERFPPQRAATPSLRQLSEQVAAVGSARAEQGARKGERVYSPRMLAGFCAMLNEGWPPAAAGSHAPPSPPRRLLLNANGSCAGCTRLPLVRGKIGRLVAAEAAASDFRCEVARGACDVRPAVWPRGDEPGLPDWYQRRDAAPRPPRSRT